MPANVTPTKLQASVQAGFKRLSNFRRARALFMRDYVGQYYDKDHGRMGNEPLNLIFNAIRVLVPNLVMNFPKHEITTEFTAYRDYAKLLSMALDAQARDTDIPSVYRRWIVDAIFCMGILKTGLCESSQVIAFDEDDRIDPGSIYTELVSLDNFTFDPDSRVPGFGDAAFIGDRMSVPRYQLLDSGLYANDLVERLPASGSDYKTGTDLLSRQSVTRDETAGIHDKVDIVELWIPRAKAIVTVPGSDMRLEKYLRITDYYGPDSGQYTFLSLTPPVPDNPMPVAPVGIWRDLHTAANRMTVKTMDQADRQKDVLTYRRAAADDAQEIVDAKDGDTVAVEDTESVKTHSFGGQQRSNEAHVAQLQMWFNLVSGNIEALGGIKSDAGTATQAEILQANGAVGLEDMRDIVYKAAGRESRIRAWYLHTDPLIEVPLINRTQVPAQYSQGAMGMELLQPARIDEEQVFLTPEARRGDFLDYHFAIKLKSMSRLDPTLQVRQTMEFLVKALPACVQAAQLSAMQGVPLSFPKLLTRVAMDQYGLEWFEEVFFDPEFQQVVAQTLLQTPGMAGSQGSLGAGVAQNGQPGNLAKVTGPAEQRNSQRQQGAAAGQSGLRTNEVI